MSTEAPPPSKRQKREALELTQTQQDATAVLPVAGSFKARFVDGEGTQLANVVEVPLANATEKNISLLLNTLLERDREDFTPYRFRIHIPGTDLIVDQFPADFLGLLQKHGVTDPFETTVTLAAEPQSVFRVQAVSRLAHSIRGHASAILAAQFSPAGSDVFATGSGDCTARIWDTMTGTPRHTLKGHTGNVIGVAWSPDATRLATCSMDKTVRVWNPETGKMMGQEFRGHAKDVRALAWEPYHLWQDGTPRLASASKDATVRVWIVNTCRTDMVLSGHKGAVSCVRWGGGGEAGTGLIYSASHDKTIKVWDGRRGSLLHNLTSHAHWVNSLALSTDSVLRTGYFDHTKDVPATQEAKIAKAKERFDKVARASGKMVERMVSASDDFTMFLWDVLSNGTKPLARMVGHQKQINSVAWSSDGTIIASAGWDNHTKLWNARDGKFINTLRGHVAPVYQCAFSPDSRLLVTASKDTTLKVWNTRSHKLVMDLPGHEDEVWAVDWAPDGKMVGSGGKDKAVKTWRN